MFCSCFFAVLHKADCCKSVPSCIVQVHSVLYRTSPSLYRPYHQVRPSVHIVHRRPSFVSPSPPSKSIPSAVQVRSVRPSLVTSKMCSPRWAAARCQAPCCQAIRSCCCHQTARRHRDSYRREADRRRDLSSGSRVACCPAREQSDGTHVRRGLRYSVERLR